MNFKDLQRYFLGGFTEREEKYLFSLYRNRGGMEILSAAIEEGWNEAANKKGPVWNRDLCFLKILKHINLIEP